MIGMIKTVTFRNWRFYCAHDSDAIVLRRVAGEQIIKMAFPFHEDTPNMDFDVSEALDLRNALDDLIGPIKRLEPPTVCPESFVSIADQSRLSALLDQYPTNSDVDRTARKAIRQAMEVLRLPTGGREY